MFIIEGPDLVGKTTLARKIVDELYKRGHYGVSYSHMSKPGDGFDFYWDYVPMLNRNVVQDRFHLGELAYGNTVYGCRQTLGQLRMLEADITRHGGVVMLITADKKWMAEHYVKREEMFDWDAIVEVNEFYQHGMHRIYAPRIDFHIHLRPGDSYPSKHKRYVAQAMDEWERRQATVRSIIQRRPDGVRFP